MTSDPKMSTKMIYISTKADLVFLVVLLLNSNIWAQKPGWKQETTKDGEVTVTYRFSKKVDQSGKKYNELEYEAVTIAAASLVSLKEVMMDDAIHMEFMEGTERVKRVCDLPGGEWVTYYYYNSPWPMPDADLITRYKLEEDPEGRRFVLTGSPAPDMYPEGKVPRMMHNHSKFTFTDMGNGIIEIVMYSKSVPLVSVPTWLIRTWIPGGPADMLNGIIDLASDTDD